MSLFRYYYIGMPSEEGEREKAGLSVTERELCVGLRTVVYNTVEPTPNQQALGSKFQPAGNCSHTIKSMMEGSSQVFLNTQSTRQSFFFLETVQAPTNTF